MFQPNHNGIVFPWLPFANPLHGYPRWQSPAPQTGGELSPDSCELPWQGSARTAPAQLVLESSRHGTAAVIHSQCRIEHLPCFTDALWYLPKPNISMPLQKLLCCSWYFLESFLLSVLSLLLLQQELDTRYLFTRAKPPQLHEQCPLTRGYISDRTGSKVGSEEGAGFSAVRSRKKGSSLRLTLQCEVGGPTQHTKAPLSCTEQSQ